MRVITDRPRVGGTLAFETVEHSARQAEALVRAHFPTAILP
jgi:hypothetical protein